MEENKYEIKFTDKRTEQKYQVDITVDGRLSNVSVQRNTLGLVDCEKLKISNVSKLEKSTLDNPVPIPIELDKK